MYVAGIYRPPPALAPAHRVCKEVNVRCPASSELSHTLVNYPCGFGKVHFQTAIKYNSCEVREYIVNAK